MYKKIITSLGLILSLSILAACNNNNNTPTTSENKEATKSGLKIAVLDIDSMQSALDYYKTKSEEFEKEQKAIENELLSLQRSIQNTANSLQKRIQSKDISDVEIQSTSKKIENMQINLQKKQENLGTALMKKQAEFSMILTAMMEAFTKEYNADAQYDLILIKSIAAFSQPEMSITADFTPKFNDWINKKLKDEAMMKVFSQKGEEKEKAKESEATAQ